MVLVPSIPPRGWKCSHKIPLSAFSYAETYQALQTRPRGTHHPPDGIQSSPLTSNPASPQHRACPRSQLQVLPDLRDSLGEGKEWGAAGCQPSPCFFSHSCPEPHSQALTCFP